MSHNRERVEKNCLNCGAEVQGRFCHVCGQENIETRETFWSLTTHFVYDILHFDGKFFYTIKYLFTRPGKVANEYVQGKRMTYLHPIRMYLFTSAVFFLIFFSGQRIQVGNQNGEGVADWNQRQRLANVYEMQMVSNQNDTSLQRKIAILRDSSRQVSLGSLGVNDYRVVNMSGMNFDTPAAYDSAQALLPVDKRDGWFKTKFKRQAIKANQVYGRSSEGGKGFANLLLHQLPYLLFVSLPFFALLLRLLYIRRKQFLYSGHAVFTLYHYVLSFLLLLLTFCLGKLESWTGWKVFCVLIPVVVLCWFVYLYLEMRNFYKQSGGKTLLKFLLLNLLASMVILLLLLLFVILSFFQV